MLYKKSKHFKYTESRAGLWTVLCIGGPCPSDTPGWEEYETEPMTADTAERHAREMVDDYARNDDLRSLVERDEQGRVVCELENQDGEIRLYMVEVAP